MEKGFKILSILLLIATLFDLYSTLINKELIVYLESNPIYKYAGLTGILIVNVIIYLLYYISYHRSNTVFFRFLTITTFVLLIYLKITVGFSNLSINESYITNPEKVLAAAKQVTDIEKAKFMINFVSANLIAPILSLITYIFFKMDHNITKKNGTK